MKPLSAEFLKSKGVCCGNKCLNCPFFPKHTKGSTNIMKKAFITGITGQDGSYLAELLLSKNYEVHGLVRRSSTHNTANIDHIINKLRIHYGDITDSGRIQYLINFIKPDEVYNLAAQSHVGISFSDPLYTVNNVGLGALNVLEACFKLFCTGFNVKLYQASSSEMYGDVLETPQNENTPFNPQSPYASAKLLAHNQVRNYRTGYGLFACSGILMNHESPRRGESFVTKKIIRELVRVNKGLQSRVFLGNLHSKRDWGYAPDYVYGMWLMLQQKEADDYVLATGEMHTCLEFLEEVSNLLNLDYSTFVKIDQSLLRPNEVSLLLGDYSKAKEKLGWEPKVKFKELVNIMVQAELDAY